MRRFLWIYALVDVRYLLAKSNKGIGIDDMLYFTLYHCYMLAVREVFTFAIPKCVLKNSENYALKVQKNYFQQEYIFKCYYFLIFFLI